MVNIQQSFSAVTNPVTMVNDHWLAVILSTAIKSSKFVLQRARMSEQFGSMKDSYSTKFKQRPQIFVNLNFIEFFDSKLSGLHPFDNMAIIHWVKNRSETKRYAVSSWETNPLLRNFYDPDWELICCNKRHLGTCEIKTPMEISLKKHFHVWHGKLSWYFYLMMEKPFGQYFQVRSLYKQHRATTKYLFLYPQGDRSGLRKPKKNMHQH